MTLPGELPLSNALLGVPRFSSLALSKCRIFRMQAVIPVTLPGEPPLSFALLGMPRSDLQLLHVTAKLGPLLGRLAPQIAEQVAAKKQQQVPIMRRA